MGENSRTGVSDLTLPSNGLSRSHSISSINSFNSNSYSSIFSRETILKIPLGKALNAVNSTYVNKSNDHKHTDDKFTLGKYKKHKSM